MKRQTNKILLWTGLLTLLVGIGMNVLSVIVNYPTNLFFIFCGIGLIQIFVSIRYKNIKIGWQIFCALLPFLILYGLFENGKPSDDIFLIPKDFRGQVIIEYGVDNGAEKEYEGKWRIYRVPENGHLKTQFTIKGSSIKSSDSTYLYVDKNNKRTKLKKYCEYCKDKDTVNIQVISGSLGTNNNHHFLDFVIDIPNYKNRNKDYSIQNTIDRLNNE